MNINDFINSDNNLFIKEHKELPLFLWMKRGFIHWHYYSPNGTIAIGELIGRQPEEVSEDEINLILLKYAMQ
jgi:hypothetical protein